MTPKEKLDAAIVEFLEASDLNITSLQGYKLRAIVEHGPISKFDPPEDVHSAVNYYSTGDYLRRTALDAPTTEYDLFAG